jgi:hypothetical protein
MFECTMMILVCTDYVYAMIKQNSAFIRIRPVCQTKWTENIHERSNR